MKLARAWRVMRKELRMGPRSPMVLWALVLPVLITLLIRGVFGGLFAPKPRLGIVDLGTSQITAQAQELEGIEVTLLSSEEQLKRRVEDNDLDAGLILQPDFDAAVRAGTQPDLQIYIGGESLASNRIVIAVTALDLIRGIAGEPAPVEVEVTAIGEEGVDLITRLLPVMVMYAVAVSGVMVPAASLVEERERRTLDALLVTPTTIGDVLVGKGGIGFVLAMLTGVITLAMNRAFGDQPVALLLILGLAGLMMAEVGLVLGSWARDSNTMFTAFKSGAVLLFYPVVFFIWPGLPQWIARLGPAYYFLKPMYDLSVSGSALGDVWVDLAIGLAICAALVPLVAVMGRRLQRELATAT